MLSFLKIKLNFMLKIELLLSLGFLKQDWFYKKFNFALVGLNGSFKIIFGLKVELLVEFLQS